MQLIARETPRVAFETFASRPRPAAPAVDANAPEPVKKAARARRKPAELEPELPGAKGVEAPVYANPAPEPEPVKK